MTTAIKTLIGKKIDEEVAEKDLESIAKKAGYSRCQLRQPGYMYDCQYDTTRLQVHVDEDKKIIDVREG